MPSTKNAAANRDAGRDPPAAWPQATRETVIEITSLIVAMLLTGAAAGIIAGMLGVGGGIVIVPVLEAVLAVFGVDASVRMHVAVGTSLATIVPTSISSAMAHRARQSIDAQVVKRWSAFIFLGAVAGVAISAFVSGRVLAGTFAVVACIVAINMMTGIGEKRFGNDLPKHPSAGLMPVTIGTLSTLMGIGGGSMTVPVLTMFGKPIHVAVGTSAFFGLVIAVPAALGYVLTGWGDVRLPPGSLGYVNLYGLVLITITSVLCAPAGARVAHALSRRQLSAAFGVFLLAAAVRLGYQAL